MLKFIAICSNDPGRAIYNNFSLILKKLKLCFVSVDNCKIEIFNQEKAPCNLVIVNTDSIDNFNNNHPDIIIFDEGFKIENQKKAAKLKKDISFALVCDDFDKSLAGFLKNGGYKVISCGANPKNSVALSSVTLDTISFFIQRELKTLGQKSIEQQEFRLFVKDADAQYAVMAAVVGALILGVKKEVFEGLIF